MKTTGNRYPYYICIPPSEREIMQLICPDAKSIWDGHNAAISILFNSQKHLPSFYTKPGYLLNDALQALAIRFDKTIVKTPVVLVDIAREFNCLYWLCKFQTIKSKNPMGKICIQKNEGELPPIFILKKGLKDYLIVKASIAEEILKAGIADIEFEGVCADE